MCVSSWDAKSMASVMGTHGAITTEASSIVAVYDALYTNLSSRTDWVSLPDLDVTLRSSKAFRGTVSPATTLLSMRSSYVVTILSSSGMLSVDAKKLNVPLLPFVPFVPFVPFPILFVEEQHLKEQHLKEQQLKEQHLREQHLREQHLKEQHCSAHHTHLNRI
eukprot:jgi/Chrpa1/1319/Chrysochromulina_OHIO_Genome00013455-RA